MVLKHFSHIHPLVFIEERSNENEKVCCSGCGEMVSGPTFSCVECEFHLHKQCSEAPSEMNHPFHRNHSLSLLTEQSNRFLCDFCNRTCENFFYHCSYGLNLHIKCALFSYNIAEKRFADFQLIAPIDSLISAENHPEKLKLAKCFACWKPLLDSLYFSPDCGFYLHAKCADLPPEINHFFHSQHPLILQFNNQRLSCHICQKLQDAGFVYSCASPCKFVLHIECVTMPTKIDHLCHRKHPLILQHKDEGLPCQVCQQTTGDAFAYSCSICKFALHIECVPLLSSPSVVSDESHQHPFLLLGRHVSFICDACGTPGKFVSYICSTCNLMVHRNCISLPRSLRYPKHPEHPIVHTYCLGLYEIDSWECRICHLKDVNSEHGGYYCSVCSYVAHVNCAIQAYNWYESDESGRIDENVEDTSALIPYSIIKRPKMEKMW